MNLLTERGSAIYGVVLGVVLAETLMLSASHIFFTGIGLMLIRGGPRAAFVLETVFFILASVGLVIGLFNRSSYQRRIPFITILSSLFLPCWVLYERISLSWNRSPSIISLPGRDVFFVLPGLISAALAILKFIQLRRIEVPPCPQ
jgi:hypothetical protein